MIVSYKTDRARRDAHQRTQVVDKIKKRLGEVGNTKKLITNQGVKKYTFSENSKTILDDERIKQDSEWDGLHGVITNLREKKSPGSSSLLPPAMENRRILPH